MKWSKESAAQGNVSRKTLDFCVCLTIMLALAAPGFCQSKETNTRLDHSEKIAMQQMQSIAEATGALLNVYMDARVSDMLVCSTTCERLKDALINPETRSDANRTLAEWLKISGAYDTVLLLDKSGVCVAASPEGLVERNLSEDANFQGAIKGKPTITDFHKSEVVSSIDPKSGGWTLTIAVPIKTGNDVEGVLVSYLKWSRLAELVASVRVGTSGYAFVLDRENRVIMHPAKQFYGIRPSDPQINLPELNDAVKKKVANYSYDFKNPITGRVDTKIVGFAYPAEYGNFPGLRWTVGAGVDRSEVVEPLLLSLLRSIGLLNK